MAARATSLVFLLLAPISALVLSPTHSSLSQTSAVQGTSPAFEAHVGGCSCDMQQLECWPAENCMTQFIEEEPQRVADGIEMRKSLKTNSNFEGDQAVSQPLGKHIQYNNIMTFQNWLSGNTVPAHIIDDFAKNSFEHCKANTDNCVFNNPMKGEDLDLVEVSAKDSGAREQNSDVLRQRISEGVSTADETLLGFAHLMRMQFNTRPEIRAEYIKHLVKVNPGKGSMNVAMHVRRSDSCNHGHENFNQQALTLDSGPQMTNLRSCTNTTVYVEKLAEIYDRYHVPLVVYLSTDDTQSVMDEIKSAEPTTGGHFKLTGQQGLNFHQQKTTAAAQAMQRVARLKSVMSEIKARRSDIYENTEFRYLDFPRSEFEYQDMIEGAQNMAFMSKAGVLDLWHLSHGQFFVGNLGSRFGKVGYVLAVARHNSALPYVSVDGHNLCCEIDEDCAKANTVMYSMTDCLTYAHELNGADVSNYWEQGSIRLGLLK